MTNNNSDYTSAKKHERTYRHNWQINNQYCRVIEDGCSPQLMKTEDAINYAQNKGVDLVEIGYDKNARCSVCKLYDYSKFMYEQKKREKIAKKQARANLAEIKEVQISLTIDDADFNRMMDRTRQFLNDGDKVKLTLRFRNRREVHCVELARDMMKRALVCFENFATLDSQPSINGKEMACILRKI